MAWRDDCVCLLAQFGDQVEKITFVQQASAKLHAA
jgi:hypothetical protein